MTYYHLTLDHNAILNANRVLAEAFFDGAIKSLAMMAPARPLLRAYDGRALLDGATPLAKVS
ncbi:hypothetical protein AADZ90_018190 [Aestuariibius sp. 2305UL40-4]|uniref:hypothetical protein n=1 Tax=Aestuariibius violaceus TaxID=3234132 RepID=UPI00345E57D7